MKIKNIIYSICSVVVLSSCNYLDITPAGKVIPEKVTEFRALVTSAYTTIPAYKYLLSVRSDELFPVSNGQTFSSYINIALWNDNASNSLVSYPWGDLYKTIFYANSVIADVMSAEIDTQDDSREQVMAEALTLRAFMHFELLNLYAKAYNATTASSDRGIPVATSIDIEQRYVPSTIEKVYEQILSDIKEAKDLWQVEEQPEGTKYRFSKKTALALEARIRLYRSEWEQALNLAEELVPTCSLEDFNDPQVTLPYEKSSKEALMNLEKIVGSSDVRDLYVLPEYMSKYKDGDLRPAKFFTKDGEYYKLVKGNGDNLKVSFRGAEIYLIAAEAAAHMDGKLDLAKTRLKALMEKRLTPELYADKSAEINSMNQQQLLEEIADERAREFVIEGHRWFDLRRTTQPEIVKPNPNGNSPTITLGAGGIGYVIPFPTAATEANPDLKN
ncbi:MAG TPA: RagB/SusD family nutrient uptake outer membrane protein [Butyricimonas virosa]|uniref:RagB/SusD family nutrient uptake outer membrane protein n=1 Tax=Butyricimonas virosa TaxID=544645 RepID=A0A921L088_9BACT|nr:RagB/SusD family nutrient uptake outer membrane protein [Butyricimonas virosa]